MFGKRSTADDLSNRPAPRVARAEPAPSVEPSPPPEPQPTTLLVETPVRSGQAVFFPNGDVTVLGSVGSGAEVIAGGSIHIYGTLRGRAMAGTSGNRQARIFCSRLAAELLAIDGYYRTAEDLDMKLRDRPVRRRPNQPRGSSASGGVSETGMLPGGATCGCACRRDEAL